MPTSYWCTPVALPDAAQVVDTFNGHRGRPDRDRPPADIHTEETVINVSNGSAWRRRVLIVSATVLILNTIRMAIFARRREVSVMKLVGATNWFIRVPFMSEGLIQGLLGSGWRRSVVYALYVVIDHYGNGRTRATSSAPCT